MSSITLEDLGLRPGQLKALASKAKRQGKSRAEYVRSLVERDLLADQSFDEILKPVRDGFRRSGVTEDQLDEIVSAARKATSTRRKRTSR
jgi:hypothetical protein